MIVETDKSITSTYRKLVSVKDTCKRIPVSKTQISKLYASGLIEGQHIGKRLFLYEDSIEDYINKEKTENPRNSQN